MLSQCAIIAMESTPARRLGLQQNLSNLPQACKGNQDAFADKAYKAHQDNRLKSNGDSVAGLVRATGSPGAKH